jgi:hypothetical protein
VELWQKFDENTNEVLAKLFHKGVFGKKISFMDVFSYVKVVLREKTRA